MYLDDPDGLTSADPQQSVLTFSRCEVVPGRAADEEQEMEEQQVEEQQEEKQSWRKCEPYKA